MGVPIKTFLCASNENKVLYDFFQTGTYDRNREFILTSSPSMDILISSNFERLIYLSAGCDASKNAELMKDLNEKGSYTVTPEMKKFMKDFKGGFAAEKENKATIQKIFKDTGYLMDTHTGVAAAVYEQYKKETQDTVKNVIASTASPYKFAGSVLEAIDGKQAGEEFQIIDRLAKRSGIKIPQAVEEIRCAPVRHSTECDSNKMKEAIIGFLWK
jgi:threonine synthase